MSSQTDAVLAAVAKIEALETENARLRGEVERLKAFIGADESQMRGLLEIGQELINQRKRAETAETKLVEADKALENCVAILQQNQELRARAEKAENNRATLIEAFGRAVELHSCFCNFVADLAPLKPGVMKKFMAISNRWVPTAQAIHDLIAKIKDGL